MEPSPDRVAILLPVGVAVAITFCTVVINALAMMPMIYFVHYELRLGRAGVRFWRDVVIVAGATVLALAAHFAFVEIIGTPRRGERHADVWRVNCDAVCDDSAINPDQTRRSKQR